MAITGTRRAVCSVNALWWWTDWPGERGLTEGLSSTSGEQVGNNWNTLKTVSGWLKYIHNTKCTNIFLIHLHTKFMSLCTFLWDEYGCSNLCQTSLSFITKHRHHQRHANYFTFNNFFHFKINILSVSTYSHQSVPWFLYSLVLTLLCLILNTSL